MPDNIEIKVPDIGDFQNVDIIDVLVKPGDQIKQFVGCAARTRI